MTIIATRPPAIKAGCGPRAPRPRRLPNVRDSWPAWTDDVRPTVVDLAVDLDIPEDGPSAPDDAFQPDVHDLSEDLGYRIGRTGEAARIEDAPGLVRRSFEIGWRRGSREYHRAID